MDLFHLFCFLLCTTIWLKITVLITNLFWLYAHGILTKTYDPLSFVFFFLGSSTISSFHFHTTVRPKYMVLYHLFFLLYTTIWQKCMLLFHLIFLLCRTIRPKITVLTDLFLLFAHDHFDQIVWSSCTYPFFCARLFDQELGCSLIYFL